MPKKKAVASSGVQSKKLDDRQDRFCSEYLVDFNATRAAIAAGYSEKTARSQASDLLTRPNVQDRVKELAESTMKETGDNRRRVILELQMIAYGDMKDFMDWKDGKIEWKDSKILGDKTRLVQEISESYSANGGSRKIKLHDKLKALEMLSKYYGLFKEQVEHSGEVTTKVVVMIPSNGRERT
jgi:phage terminase small subunit